MKKIKLATNLQTESQNEKDSLKVFIDLGQPSRLKEAFRVSEADFKKKIAETVSEVWGKMGSLKITINEVRTGNTDNEFLLVYPKSQHEKISFILFFVEEINNKKVRLRLSH